MKKKLFFRLISMFLIVVMLGSMIVACNNGGDDPADDKTPSGNNGGNTETPGDTENPGDAETPGGEVAPPEDEVAVDMKGYEFHALARELQWFVNEVTAEPDTGDHMLQAIYDRNWEVQKKYNCVMTQTIIPMSDEFGTWRRSVGAGESIYKYGLAHMMETAGESLNGSMLNLKTLPHINLEAEYWNQTMNKELTIGDRLYFTANEYCTSSVYYTWLMIFNMQLCAERGIDVYGMIEDGTWTVDNLYKIISSSYEDDGDGIVEFEDDFFGLISHWNTVLTNYIFAFEIPVISIDANNKVVVGYNDANTPMVTAVEKVYDLFYNSANGGIIMTDEMNPYGADTDVLTHDEAMCTKLSTNKALFANTRILGLEVLRSVDVQYGIIPFPKFNEEQKEYHSHVDGSSSLLFVPYTLPDAEYDNVGLLLEVLAQKTKEDVMPVINNSVLIGRYSEDSDAYKCLEMTLDGRSYAFGYVFDFDITGRPYWSIVHILEAGSNNFIDYWKPKANVSTRDINNIVKKYAKANK